MRNQTRYIFPFSPSRNGSQGATLVEVLVYMVLALGLLSLLVFFLSKTVSYYAFVTDKVKLSETASLLVRQLKQDVEHTVLGRVTLISNNQDRQVSMDYAEAIEPDGTVKWSDDQIWYSFGANENKVFRWIGGQDELPAKISSGDFRSWPYITTFELEKATPRTLSFEINMTLKDTKERTHRYTAGGAIDVMGGHPVK